MNRNTFQIAVTKRLLWMLFSVLMMIVAAPRQVYSAPLKMTCTEHGEDDMTLVFVRQAGAGGRTIEIAGTGSTTLWTVTVNGTDATPASQTKANPGRVNVQVGDKITWKVGGTKHGIVFPTQAEAEVLFSFDPNQGQPLGASTEITGYKWGTAGFRNTTLAVATVKAEVNKDKPAADKEKTNLASAPLKMTCTEHGDDDMTLVFAREAGAGGRSIEIVGTGSTTLWTVTVDGADVTPAAQTKANPGPVNVQVGDKITWKVGGTKHGIVFPTQAEAEALFSFDLNQGQPLGASTEITGYTWGTAGFRNTTLAVATVKAAVSKDKPAADKEKTNLASASLKMTCTEHGEDEMTLVFVREAGAGGRTIEIAGTPSTTLWTVTVNGTDATPAAQTKANPGPVNVQVGDKITWKVGGTRHGIVFPTQAGAEALLSFDPNQGQPLGASTEITGYKWGTAGFRNTTLAVATVKAAVSKDKPAADKEKTNLASASLKMTCTEHGDDDMTLVFAREAGAGGRTIEIVGTGSTTLWTVTVDGADVTPAAQTKANPGPVNVQVGDKITWKVGGTRHGIVFPTQTGAEALFSFDPNQGQPLGASTEITGYTWGTAGFRNTTLAVATVKAVGISALRSTGAIEYWIQLENKPWDLSPRGMDRLVQDSSITASTTRDIKLPDDPGTVDYSLPGFSWTRADALVLRRYTAPDGNSGPWTIPDDRKVNPWDLNERDPRSRDSSGGKVFGTGGTIPGATIECDVGQEVRVHYRNMDNRPLSGNAASSLIHSLHTHGFVFAQESDGAYPLSKLDLSQEITADELDAWKTVPHPDGPSTPNIEQFRDPASGKFFKRGDRVPPKGTFIYSWRTISWPTTSGVWIYHDHSINDTESTSLGAIGFVVIHNPNDPNDVQSADAIAELPPGPDSAHSFVGSPISKPEVPKFKELIGQPILAVPKQAQYLLLFHKFGPDGLPCINGRLFLGNTPTLIAGEQTKMRFGVAGMGDAREGFHTFHIHGHRWVIPGPDGNTDAGGGLTGGQPIQNSPMVRAVSQFEDTKVLGPANSFVFTINEGAPSFMRAEPALGEWHMHCHVLSHMTSGMMGSLLVARPNQALDLPYGVKNPEMIQMRKLLFQQMRELQHGLLLEQNR